MFCTLFYVFIIQLYVSKITLFVRFFLEYAHMYNINIYSRMWIFSYYSKFKQKIVFVIFIKQSENLLQLSIPKYMDERNTSTVCNKRNLQN